MFRRRAPVHGVLRGAGAYIALQTFAIVGLNGQSNYSTQPTGRQPVRQLEKELAEQGYDRISIEALQAYQDGEVKLSLAAHIEYEDFMAKGRKLFGISGGN